MAAEKPKTWADLAYEMWALLCNSVHDGHGAADAPAQWEARKVQLRDALHTALESYPPVRVPENTGKHPGESDETGTYVDWPARVRGLLAELGRLATETGKEAERFRGTSNPMGFGPTRAYQAYANAFALAEDALGAEAAPGPRFWPRLDDPPTDVQRVQNLNGTVWERMGKDGHYWSAPGWENGVAWAQVLRWGPVHDITKR